MLQTITLLPADLTSALKESQQQNSTPQYVLFYGSLVDGKSWCEDSRDAEPTVSRRFGDSKEDVKVVYAGQKAE